MCVYTESSTQVIQKYLDPGIKINNLYLRNMSVFVDTNLLPSDACNYGTALLVLKFSSYFLDKRCFK